MTEDQIFARMAKRLLPFVMLLYVVNYIDRVNVGFAALTMNKDLGLSPAVFGFGASIFFIGYLIFQVPANLILDRIGARRWVFIILAVWGVLSACNAFIVGEYSFYAIRFFLGIAEAGFFPGMLLYMTFWFPQSWRSRFVGVFMAAIPLANIIGGPLSTTILGLDGVAGLHGWQWMFILEGIPASLLGFVSLKLLPDRPASASWLTDEEKRIVIARLKTDEGTSEHRDFWPALMDMRVIALGLVLLGNQIGLYGVQLWLPQIVKGMGFSNFATGFVVALCFISAMVAMIYWARRSDAKRERVWHVAIPLLLGALGLVVAAVAQSDFLVLVSLAIALVGMLAYNGPFFALPSTFLAGTAAAGGVGFVNTIGSLGRFIGPYGVGVLKESSGGYASAMAAMGVCMLMSALIVLAMGRKMGARQQSAAAEAAKPV
jgi:ACS family tartrate transporter-like MFS transporter